MTKFHKRYVCCSIVLVLLVFIVYYFYEGRIFGNEAIDSNEFIAVAYVTDDEESESHLKIRWDDDRLLNLKKFRYKIQPNVCVAGQAHEDLLAILLVTSYVGHDEVRSAHRAAIASALLQKLNVLRVFLLAEIPPQEKFITQNAIEDESQHFNDIVQGNFVEAYRNLTYKHTMGLRWSSSHPCIRPKFIIKMDDDIVVDFFYLINYLSTRPEAFHHVKKRHFLAGYIFRNVVPIRAHQNKWYVSRQEFNGIVYPDYLSGWMYVTTPHTAQLLVATASEPSTKQFWIDDTWITGILRTRLNIPIDQSLNGLFSANSQFLDCCLNDLQLSKYQCPFIAGPNGGDNTLIRKFVQTIYAQCYNHSLVLTTNLCHTRPSEMPPLKKTCVGSDKHLLRENHGAAIVSAVKL